MIVNVVVFLIAFLIGFCIAKWKWNQYKKTPIRVVSNCQENKDLQYPSELAAWLGNIDNQLNHIDNQLNRIGK